MTDKLEYSEAWQDVKEELDRMALVVSALKIATERARAADAQQHRELQERLQHREFDVMTFCMIVGVEAEEELEPKLREMAQQIAALQAEQAQWQQRLRQLIADWREAGDAHYSDPAYNAIATCATDLELQLAALQTEDK